MDRGAIVFVRGPAESAGNPEKGGNIAGRNEGKIPDLASGEVGHPAGR